MLKPNIIIEYGQKLITGMRGKEFRNGVVYGVKESMPRMASNVEN